MKEKFVVFACRELDFTDESGKKIQGLSIYMGQPTTEKGWKGMSCEKFFIRKDSPAYPMHFPVSGSEIVVEFNRFGKITSIEV